MGSEQSSQQNVGSKSGRSHLPSQLKRGKTVPGPSSQEDEEDNERNGSISPGPSVCSDSDLPYISYTVNRPIGGNYKNNFNIYWNLFSTLNSSVIDSPKLSSKPSGALQRGKSLGSTNSSPTRRKFSATRKSTTTKSTGHDIVVVKPAKEPDSQDKDPYLLKLQNIPMFLPIMRGTLNLPGR